MKITPELIPDVVEFSIPKFEKYNPRKDVTHTRWFRLETKWYLSKSFHGLSGAQVVLFPVLLGEYAGTMSGQFQDESGDNVGTISDNARIPIDYLVKHLKSKSHFVRRTLAEFYNRGIIVIHNLLTVRDVPIQTDRQTKQNKTLSRPSGPSPSDLIEVWNQNRGPLPEVTKLAKTRYAKAKVRLNEEPDLGYWERVVKTIAETPFLRGENDRGWKADFDWLIANDANHVKVSEGKYGGSSQVITAESELARLEARFQAAREERI